MKVKLTFLALIADLLLNSNAATIDDDGNNNEANQPECSVNYQAAEESVIAPLDHGNKTLHSIEADVMIMRDPTVINGNVYYVHSHVPSEKTLKKIKRSSKRKSKGFHNTVNVHVENSIDLVQLQAIHNQNNNQAELNQRYEPQALGNINNNHCSSHSNAIDEGLQPVVEYPPILCECEGLRQSEWKRHKEISDMLELMEVPKGDALFYVSRRWDNDKDTDFRVVYGLPEIKLNQSDFVLPSFSQRGSAVGMLSKMESGEKSVYFTRSSSASPGSVNRRITKIEWMDNNGNYKHYFSISNDKANVLFYPKKAVGVEAPGYLQKEPYRVIHEYGQYKLLVPKHTKVLAWSPSNSAIERIHGIKSVSLSEQTLFMVADTPAGNNCLGSIENFLNQERIQNFSLVEQTKWIGSFKGCQQLPLSVAQRVNGKFMMAKMIDPFQWNYSGIPHFSSDLHIIDKGDKWVLTSRPAFTISADGQVQLDYHSTTIVAIVRNNKIIKQTESFRLLKNDVLISVERNEEAEKCLKHLSDSMSASIIKRGVSQAEACRNLSITLIRAKWAE